MKKIFIAIVLLVLLASIAYALPVFPGAEGFGVDTPAGRGGTIYKVTNLNPTGPGSLKECIDATGPRVCVFEVSGTIPVNYWMTISNPYITIAGQTAPSPGITLRGAVFRITTHDVLMQHVRFRVGDDPGGTTLTSRDGIAIAEGAYNVVVDHCSVSWAMDGGIDIPTHADSHDITVSNCIIAEGLETDVSEAKAMLVGVHIKNLAILKNVFAHNHARNPFIHGDTKTLVVNNVQYDMKYTATEFTDTATPQAAGTYSSVIGNVIFPGPSSVNVRWASNINKIVGKITLYVEDNDCPEGNSDPWDNVHIANSSYTTVIQANEPPVMASNLNILPSSQVLDYMYENVGARPADRDSVDIRILNEVRDGTGSWIVSQEDVGSWPVLAENYREFVIPNNPDEDDDGDGYTNLEEVLHEFSAQVEGGEPPTCITHSYKACYNGDVYWYDSCGNIEEIDTECGTMQCIDNECIPIDPEYIWLEAEDSDIYSPMQIGTDGRASNGEYIFTPASTPDTRDPQTEASLSFPIPQTGEYYLWAGIYADSKDSDASYVGFNGNFDRIYPVNINEYEWVKVEETHNSGDYTHSLSQGQNIINTGHGEGGARIDRFLVTNDNSYVPSSYGEPIEGDVNNDGEVGLEDLVAVAGDFGKQTGLNYQNSDTDNNGVIDIFDVVFVATRIP